MQKDIDKSFATATLFAWYDRNGRDLPWRRRWPEMAPAYHVWLSEIMLQQTVVATVIPYFLEFTRRWPSINMLAAAPADDVLTAWAGLGYYARARNLHKAAIIVAEEWDGEFHPPNVSCSYDSHLRSLPGVGPYTAGAIAAIAFGQQAIVVDGNIERILSRYFGIETPIGNAKNEISEAYQSLLPVDRPSDLPQALMDYANAVCTPKRPRCEECCLAGSCIAFAKSIVQQLPKKPAKMGKPLRRSVVFVAVNHCGQLFLHRRPEKGLLGGTLAFPETGLSSKTIDPNLNDSAAPFVADWVLLDKHVSHVFTHFVVNADIYFTYVDANAVQNLTIKTNGNWQSPSPSKLTSFMRKISTSVQQQLKGRFQHLRD